MKNPVGRPRTRFTPYKDIKRKKSGTVIFYLDGEFLSDYDYTCPSLRTIRINDFKRMAKRNTMVKHTYHYIIIPNIEP
jgi:hypothetical protein